jgi:hypothetical protein
LPAQSGTQHWPLTHWPVAHAQSVGQLSQFSRCDASQPFLPHAPPSWHWPSLQSFPAPQSPQEPLQPSSPHSFPSQLGLQQAPSMQLPALQAQSAAQEAQLSPVSQLSSPQ